MQGRGCETVVKLAASTFDCIRLHPCISFSHAPAFWGSRSSVAEGLSYIKSWHFIEDTRTAVNLGA